MPAPRQIRMTMVGPLKGITKVFGKYNFVNGTCDVVGSDEQMKNVIRYFTRSYQVEVSDPNAEPVIPAPDPALVAPKVDDSKVISDEDLEAKAVAEQDEKDNPEPEQPNKRQQDIIAAINGIDKADYVDLTAKTPRPKVKDVQMLMEDPTVNKNEIIEVIQKWLS